VSPDKIIIMAAPAQPPMGGPPQDFGPPGPISTAEVRILYLLVQIQHGLGRMEEAIASLKAVADSNNEEIKRLIERTIKAETTLANVDKTVDRHHADLDGLGARHNEDLSKLKNDLNQMGGRLENKINELGTELRRETSEIKTNDIGPLKGFVGIAKKVGAGALFVLGPVATAIFIAIAVHAYRVIDRLLILANSPRP